MRGSRDRKRYTRFGSLLASLYRIQSEDRSSRRNKVKSRPIFHRRRFTSLKTKPRTLFARVRTTNYVSRGFEERNDPMINLSENMKRTRTFTNVKGFFGSLLLRYHYRHEFISKGLSLEEWNGWVAMRERLYIYILRFKPFFFLLLVFTKRNVCIR